MGWRGGHRLGATLVAVLALALAAPGAAPAQGPGPCIEGESLQSCLFHQQQDYRLPMEVKQWAALVNPRRGRAARRLYRALVPPQFSMPKRPVVGLWMVDVAVPRRGSPQVWREGSIALLVRRGGEHGWFQLSEPVDDPLFYDYGRAVGFAKYMAAMETGTADGAEVATASVENRVSMRTAWRAARGRASEALRRWSFHDDPWVSLHHVFEGPKLMRVKYTAEPPLPGAELPEPRFGRISYRLDPKLDRLDRISPQPLPDLFPRGTSLADLIPARGTVAGTYLAAPLNLHIQIAETGDCGRCWPGRARGTAP